MHISEAFEKMTKLNNGVKAILKEIEYSSYEDLSGLDYDRTNPNELLIIEEMRSAAERLVKFSQVINYLNRNILETRVLYRNDCNRFETVSGTKQYTCGSIIEYQYIDDVDEILKWRISSVEHSDGAYYIVGHKKMPLEGLTVRIRETPNWFD